MTEYNEKCMRQTSPTTRPNGIPEGWLDCNTCGVRNSDNLCLGYYGINMTEEQYHERRKVLAKKLGITLPEERTLAVRV